MVKGIYVLAISIRSDRTIRIGALGLIPFKQGIYAYVGSAKRGLEHRIKRHFQKNKRTFWHIDYLLSSPVAAIVKVFYKEAEKEEECGTAGKLAEKGVHVRGFGCSDCNCSSHLFYFESLEKLEKICFSLGFVPLSSQ